MKKHIKKTDRSKKTAAKRTLALLLAAVFVLPLLSSCQSGGIEENTALPLPSEPEFTVPESIESPVSEVRGVWVASVYNLDYPSASGLTKSELEKELDTLIENCLDLGLNTVFFQVRPEGDALYKSDIFPQSAYISGTQGKSADGNFDSLEYLVDRASAVGIKIYAWVNPLRAALKGNEDSLAQSSPAIKDPEYTVKYADGNLYYNPAIPKARELVADGAAEIAKNYDVAGIVFDDYFYPYPVYENGALAEFDDKEQYITYGGSDSLEDWRRENINTLIELCNEKIKEADEDCLFGIAPFGIWQNSNGENGGSATMGNESYHSQYADSLAWVNGGYIDFIAPQIYWSFSTSVAPYDTLVRWWSSKLSGTDCALYISTGDYRYETEEDFEGEITRQVEFARTAAGYRGTVHYRYSSLISNEGLLEEIKALHKEKLEFPNTESNGEKISVTSPQNGSTLTSDKTYIIGRADPAMPLYCQGELIPMTKSGIFTAYVPLSQGKNEIELKNGENTYTHTVYYSYGGSSVTFMDSYRIESPFPAEKLIGRAGSSITVSCYAPAGSTVTAELGDIKVSLKEASGGAIYGNSNVRAYYEGTLPLPEKEGDAGVLIFRSVRTQTEDSAAKATARVSVIGKAEGYRLEVKNDGATMLDSRFGDEYRGYIPQSVGMTDFGIGCTDGMWETSFGGYISEEDLTVGELAEAKTFSARQAMFYLVDGNTTILIKSADRPAIDIKKDKNEISVILKNTSFTDTTVTKGSNDTLLSHMTMENKGEDAVAVLTLNDEFGIYGITYEYTVVEGVSLISITLPAKGGVKDGALPLEGKKIVLDAGHGGSDPGALGAIEGIDEAELNLAVTLKLKEKLEALGAAVLLTRDSDYYMPLTERADFIVKEEPDISISIHHNSIGYNLDPNNFSGTLGLYTHDSAKTLAEALANEVSFSLGRKNEGTRWQELRLCINHRFPSALVELGYMTCPEEYEFTVSEKGQEKIAEALARGILNYFEN